MNRYVSIDIGGTAIKYGLIREDGQILTREVIDTEAKKADRLFLTKWRILLKAIACKGTSAVSVYRQQEWGIRIRE